MQIAHLPLWQALPLAIILSVLTCRLIDKLMNTTGNSGKLIEQSGGLFIEYDHCYIWAWLKFPKELISIFRETTYVHGINRVQTAIWIASMRCKWATKYYPLHASQAEVLEYYRRVKWAKTVIHNAEPQ